MAVIKVKDNDKWISIPFSGGGDSLPKDGVPGQVLKKTDDGAEWDDTFPKGGATGQVLKKSDAGVVWDDANNHTHSASSITDSILSNCTTSDNGKFLRVVNGVAAWSTVPNAEGASF